MWLAELLLPSLSSKHVAIQLSAIGSTMSAGELWFSSGNNKPQGPSHVSFQKAHHNLQQLHHHRQYRPSRPYQSRQAGARCYHLCTRLMMMALRLNSHAPLLLLPLWLDNPYRAAMVQASPAGTTAHHRCRCYWAIALWCLWTSASSWDEGYLLLQNRRHRKFLALLLSSLWNKKHERKKTG